MPHSLRVLLVEDRSDAKMQRSMLSESLISQEMEVLEACTMQDALDAAYRFEPDVIIVEVVLSEQGSASIELDSTMGIELAQRLCEQDRVPQMGIVFLLTCSVQAGEPMQLVSDLGDCVIYLPKLASVSQLLEAIHKIAKGSTNLYVRSNRMQPQHKTPFQLALDTLTPEERSYILLALQNLQHLSVRQNSVFETVGACRTFKQAADEINIALHSLHSHMRIIYDKLEMSQASSGLNPAALLAKAQLLSRLQQMETQGMSHPSYAKESDEMDMI